MSQSAVVNRQRASQYAGNDSAGVVVGRMAVISGAEQQPQ